VDADEDQEFKMDRDTDGETFAVRIGVIQQSPADDGDGGVLPNPAFQHHPGTARVRP
jgi:hypothetical protein